MKAPIETTTPCEKTEFSLYKYNTFYFCKQEDHMLFKLLMFLLNLVFLYEFTIKASKTDFGVTLLCSDTVVYVFAW